MKNIRVILWGLVVVAVVGLVVAKVASVRSAPPPAAELFATEPVTLTDQEGRSFSTAALRGGPWIADCIFTSCAGTCPILSHQMAELQKTTPARVQLVSFTVDPEHDTPAVLKEYAQALHADFSRWHFLTGTPREMSDAVAAMKLPFSPAANGYALMHSEKMLLVNRTGHVVGVYDGTNAKDVQRLSADATRLANDGGNPS